MGKRKPLAPKMGKGKPPLLVVDPVFTLPPPHARTNRDRNRFPGWGRSAVQFGE